jgi:hypothetical protein
MSTACGSGWEDGIKGSNRVLTPNEEGGESCRVAKRMKLLNCSRLVIDGLMGMSRVTRR